MISTGEPAPDFELIDDQGISRRLSGYLGKRVLLVFYPGDNTPVCTRQLCDYRDGIAVFSSLNTEVLAISGDSRESHEAFRAKHDLPFVLLTDPGLEVAEMYGCKGMFGMKRGVILVDETGVVRWEHIESIALFRRTRDELAAVIAALDNE